MCGIAGILNFNGERVEPVRLVRMARQIKHRGPDDLGIYTNKLAGLAHTRLSIIDLASGQQPMHNEDKSLSIVFNGEIFNYIELKNDLRSEERRVGKECRFGWGRDRESNRKSSI